MPESNLDKWESEKVVSIEADALSQKFLSMSEGDFNKFVTKVREARESEKSKKEALDFAKEISKEVIIPLLLK